MTHAKLFLAPLTVAALVSGCVGGGNDPVDTIAEIEATTDQDIDGDGLIVQNGVEVGVSD